MTNLITPITKAITKTKDTKNKREETEPKPFSTTMLCPDTDIKDVVFLKTSRSLTIFSRKIAICPEYSPIKRHNSAIPPIPTCKEKEDSFALEISALLGRAKNVAPKAFTKQANAKPPV